MLPTSDQERTVILDYVASQVTGERVILAQKLYTERVGPVVHDIWDVHTNAARWWVVTPPTMLYSQEQFPNMDLALTFHVGLCVRMPRGARAALDDLWAEPFIACARGLDDVRDALGLAVEVQDFQAVGVRTREVLISLMNAAQELLAADVPKPHPNGADVTGWADVVGNVLFPGSSNAHRRRLAKKATEEAWEFDNWLTHAHNAGPHDAEAALELTTLVVAMFSTALVRRARGVPDQCPECGSRKLSPERAVDPADQQNIYERAVCDRCAWRGATVLVRAAPTEPRPSATGECVVMTRPLLSPWKR